MTITRWKNAATPLAVLVLAASVFAVPALDDDRGDPAAVAATLAIKPGTAPLTAPTALELLKPLHDLYVQHIQTLADPFMEGRAPGTDGNRRAADYLEFHYKRLGLLPPFDPVENEKVANPPADKDAPKDEENATKEDASQATSAAKVYRQVFVAPPSLRPGDSIFVDTQKLTAQPAAGAAMSFAPTVDFNPLGYSASKSVTAPMVFVGYSIEEGSDDYTSYPLVQGKEHDLTGKIAVVLRFEPMNEQGKSLWSSVRWSGAASLDGKLRSAADRGAAGIILINPPGADDPRAAKLDDVSLGGGGRRDGLKIPVVMMTPDAGDRLVKAADPQGRSLLDLRKLVDADGLIIDLPNAQVSIDVQIRRKPLLTDNVGALLPGSGALKDQYIVVGSHYDHVGYGYFGSRDPNPRGKLHPGADDNASGTSGNLTIARRMSEAYGDLGDTPRRSVLFLAFCAEESGLNGSRYYTLNPIVPIEDHTLMVNLDMIGRLREQQGLEMGGVDTAEGLRDWLKPYIESAPFKIAPKPSGLGPSDHASFASAGVPVLFLFTGLHKEYHAPQDTADTINVDGATQVADLAYRVVLDAALRPDRFVFTSPTGSASGDNDNSQTTSMSGVSVRFGIAPGDYSGNDGVMIGEVLPGLPAEKAGLKAGDIMKSWDGVALEGVEQWMSDVLSKHKPGDKVTIVYIRDEKEATTEAELIARTGRQ
jgi:Zn-dependent M28 family amino/carboxypeptidase